jgi:hypothetical protein
VVPAFALYRLGILSWRLLARDAGVPDGQIDEHHRSDLPVLIGFIERPLYLSAWLSGGLSFVGLWLGLKVAGGWNGWSQDRKVKCEIEGMEVGKAVTGRHLFNSFLVGSSLSLLCALSMGIWVEWRRQSLMSPAWILLWASSGALAAIWLWTGWRGSTPKVERKRASRVDLPASWNSTVAAAALTRALAARRSAVLPVTR